MTRFIKILPYLLYPAGMDRYSRACDLLSGTANPGSQNPGSLLLAEPVVLHSPLARCVSCLAQSKNQTQYERAELAEIPFTLSRFLTRRQFLHEGSAGIRQAFVDAFISDHLNIPRAELFRQARAFFEELGQHANAAVVSHSFRLKLLQAYHHTGGALEHQPELIAQYILRQQRTFNFGEWFFM